MRTTNQSGTPLDPPPMPRSAFAYAEQASRPGRRFGGRPGRVTALLLGLLFLLIGTLGTIAAAFTLATQFGLTSGPLLRMGIAECSVAGTGKATDILCAGTAAPGYGKQPAGEWVLDHAERDYAAGAVVDVRCDPFGQCTTIDERAKAQGFFGLGFGLLIASGSLAAGLAAAPDRLRPGRRVLLRCGWVRCSLVAWFGGLSLLTVASVITWAAA